MGRNELNFAYYITVYGQTNLIFHTVFPFMGEQSSEAGQAKQRGSEAGRATAKTNERSDQTYLRQGGDYARRRNMPPT